jgi:hypothetical protein
MNHRVRKRPIVLAPVAALLLLAGCGGPKPLSPKMSTFVTSVGLGDGGNLGGVAGADAHCQRLAVAAGSSRTWRAYLSAPASGSTPAINARERIGSGPWFNQQGTEIAASLDSLHSDSAGINYGTALTEQGRHVPSNIHDMLTGSNAQGLLATNAADTTCRGWMSNDAGRAMLGHSDGKGGQPNSLSWNAAHISNGCSPNALAASGGSGLFYCFASD